MTDYTDDYPTAVPPHVPDSRTWVTSLSAYLCSGQEAVDAATEFLSSTVSTSSPMAVDTETRGLGADSYFIKCVTFAWEGTDGTVAVLLDPRNPAQEKTIRDLLNETSGLLVFHNAPFDVPPMVHRSLLATESISRVWDTKVAGSMAYTLKTDSKSLQALAARPEVLDLPPGDSSMTTAFTAAGMGRQSDGWRDMDIDSPVYAQGAMADTVVTLRLAPVLVDRVVQWLTTGPDNLAGTVTPDRALDLLEREQNTNRIMMRASARGLAMDPDYLDNYTQEVSATLEAHQATVEAAGLDPDAGNVSVKLAELLDARGELPANWPRTATGKLSGTKDNLALLDGHPLAEAVVACKEGAKSLMQLQKAARFGEVDGRIHPQVNVLGASATGRMSYSEPPLQQFADVERGIIVPDPGRQWVSIDWSSIEPVVVANCAGDRAFLEGFNHHGADLYAPITEQAGIPRKVAKVVLLAALYGQGRALLATTLTQRTGEPHTEEDAKALQDSLFSTMPETRRFLDDLRRGGETQRCAVTADGRRQEVPVDKVSGQVMGYKATNYFTQGTAYSVMSEAINQVAQAGLEDAIHLAMHDELVVDQDAAVDVQRIMETPPEWLQEYASRAGSGQVVLRTDAQPLRDLDNGHDGRWRYV